MKLDHEYLSKDPANNAVRQVGLILSWYDHQTTDKDVNISVNYIYIITVRTYRDMFQCLNLTPLDSPTDVR